MVGKKYHADTNRADVYFVVKPGPEVKAEITGDAHAFIYDNQVYLDPSRWKD